MNPRKIGAWAGRVLLSAGIVATVFFGAPGAASASDDPAAGSSVVAVVDSGISTMAEPGWD
ncbi:MAG: hypothetical protein ACRDTU_05090 [Micromonosporaceae bacterium]